jgi:hypothetical protein
LRHAQWAKGIGLVIFTDRDDDWVFFQLSGVSISVYHALLLGGQRVRNEEFIAETVESLVEFGRVGRVE